MKPSVGRIVHYHINGEDEQLQPLAAIITKVGGEQKLVDGKWVDAECLTVFHPVARPWTEAALFSEEPKLQHWSWPPRV